MIFYDLEKFSTKTSKSPWKSGFWRTLILSLLKSSPNICFIRKLKLSISALFSNKDKVTFEFEHLTIFLSLIPKGESKCYAYLQFRHRSSASEAIDNLNNTYWDIKYDPDFHYQKYKERLFYLKQSQPPGRMLPSLADESQLISELDKKSMHGKKLYVGIFKKKDEYFRIKKEKEGKPSNLYVKNFGPNFGDRDLFNLFKVFGSIKSAKVRRQKFGLVEKPLGCGFVDFEEPEEAEAARLALDGHVLTNSGRVISVTYADCKSRRMRKRLEESMDEGGPLDGREG